eukprot:CAMPEP_0175945490 /NCGR_PEP_ID=MMETSP0108-20121206/26743_1 /TAXON_ID=195067 ORGANISM="Goniomonas pacifica, Strain CCMP1869" /NCGR_SAMPLE_ID=MMETSP0108 /ASSEMBLY_ACC=CAM_ASM_000204 /LENGTH=58 /DNA_ID=CAMNT_0017270783 /DNA_START=22 /DNA_END=198 /DNA_ORIENTATION=+
MPLPSPQGTMWCMQRGCPEGLHPPSGHQLKGGRRQGVKPLTEQKLRPKAACNTTLPAL